MNAPALLRNILMIRNKAGKEEETQSGLISRRRTRGNARSTQGTGPSGPRERIDRARARAWGGKGELTLKGKCREPRKGVQMRELLVVMACVDVVAK